MDLQKILGKEAIMKFSVTYVEFRRILTALMVCEGGDSALIAELHAQDPANDGPEVAILSDTVRS